MTGSPVAPPQYGCTLRTNPTPKMDGRDRESHVFVKAHSVICGYVLVTDGIIGQALLERLSLIADYYGAH